MPLWTKDVPPKSQVKIGKNAVSTNKGWKDPKNKEVLVAISNLAEKAGEANILSVKFDKSAYEREDAISIIVQYNEYVDVTAGAKITVSWSGVSGNFDVVALEQEKVFDVVFSGLVPDEEGILSLVTQSIDGNIVDNNDGVTASELLISADNAAGAGSFEVL